jgi:hypothetical protein
LRARRGRTDLPRLAPDRRDLPLMAGIEASQVALVMGWSEKAVDDLKRKYVSRTAVVQAVLAKLEKAV